MIALFSFFAEYVDSSLGMGYGTTLTPVLLLLGFASSHVVPAVLLSEFVTGLLAAGFHHTFQNVRFQRHSIDLRVALALCGCGLVGSLVAVLFAVQLPEPVLKIYIGSLVFVMGGLILFARDEGQRFSWGRLLGLGLLGSFNKGLSGGGYGPLLTTGQILSGVSAKSAVGITSLAEGVISFAAVGAYVLSGKTLDWLLVLPVVSGAAISTPLAAYTVKHMQFGQLKQVIGVVTVLLGLVTLVRAFQ